MSSIEALWLVKFGDWTAPNSANNGGVIIFESGSAFGGDSGFAYVGNYDLANDKLIGEVTATKFDPEMTDVWGIGYNEAKMKVELERDGDERMVGRLTLEGQSLPVFLVRFKELP